MTIDAHPSDRRTPARPDQTSAMHLRLTDVSIGYGPTTVISGLHLEAEPGRTWDRVPVVAGDHRAVRRAFGPVVIDVARRHALQYAHRVDADHRSNASVVERLKVCPVIDLVRRNAVRITMASQKDNGLPLNDTFR